MSSLSASASILRLSRSFQRLNTSDPLTQCLIPRLNRGFATAVEVPVAETGHPTLVEASTVPTISSNAGRVLTTLYSWPDLEPRRFEWYPSQHLDMPLRKDILHRAVIHEADVTRGMSTASTKWRKDVHGSNRKLAPQKGLGRARVGDKKSPIRRGGGVAFGPHPRDFATELPRKIYDMAWRTALSHRYRLGELIILEDRMNMPLDWTPRLLVNIFEKNKWDHSNGRSLLVTDRVDFSKIRSRDQDDPIKMLELQKRAKLQRHLFDTMAQIGRHGSIKDLNDVDVKDLLETGRVIIDRQTLSSLFTRHSADLKSSVTHVY